MAIVALVARRNVIECLACRLIAIVATCATSHDRGVIDKRYRCPARCDMTVEAVARGQNMIRRFE